MRRAAAVVPALVLLRCQGANYSRKEISALTMQDKIVILGEEFERKHIPKVARMFDTSPEHAKQTISSLAYLWHNGSVVSAVQALESDLGGI